MAHDFLVDAEPSVPLIEALSRRPISMAFPHVVTTLISIAFDHGGYVAGGFARFMARFLHPGMQLPSGDDEEELFMGLQNFRLRNQIPTRENIARLGPYWRAGSADVDLWFPSIEHVDAFLNDERVLPILKDKNVVETSSPEGASREFVVRETRVQVITKFLGERHDRLSTFDIYNAMVAFDRDTITLPRGWIDLEARKMLHVVNWDSPWTLNRVFKYLSRKGYELVTPQTSEALVERFHLALKHMSQCKTADEWLQSQMYKRTKAREPKHLVTRFVPAMKSFTNDQLLFMAGLRPLDRYNYAFNLLRDRAGVDAPKIPTT